MIEIVSNSPSETIAVARTLAAALVPGDVILLEGPLGSGKTCFVRGLASGLGMDAGLVSSPTFVLCQEYQHPDGAPTLVHLDAYRMSGVDELGEIGWEAIASDPDVIIAIEWPGIVDGAWADRWIRVGFEHLADAQRHLEIDASPACRARLEAISSTLTDASADCRTCGEPVPSGSETAPFCSSRCRMADLGRWFAGGHRISRPLDADDFDGFEM